MENNQKINPVIKARIDKAIDEMVETIRKEIEIEKKKGWCKHSF